MTKLDFTMLSESLFAHNQIWTFSSSSLILDCNVLIFLCL